jgi:hypothetical protein
MSQPDFITEPVLPKKPKKPKVYYSPEPLQAQLSALCTPQPIVPKVTVPLVILPRWMDRFYTTTQLSNKPPVGKFAPKSSRKPPVGKFPSKQTRKPPIGILPIKEEVETEEVVETEESMDNQSSYTKDEIASMSDSTLLMNWIGITGHAMLGCCHCGKKSPCKPLATHWMKVIRNHCSKHGIYKDMPIPKTCDTQWERNNLVNDINNWYYGIVRKNKTSITEEELASLKQERKEKLAEVGVIMRDA